MVVVYCMPSSWRCCYNVSAANTATTLSLSLQFTLETQHIILALSYHDPRTRYPHVADLASFYSPCSVARLESEGLIVSHYSEPSMLETFSRTVRNYVPTSIPVPIAAPSPARVSRPVSFGSFLVAPGGVGAATPSNPRRSSIHIRQSSGLSSQPTGRIRSGVPFDSNEVDDDAVFGSEDEDQESTFAGDQRLASYPTAGEGDTIMWSCWDTLSELNSKSRCELSLCPLTIL
ncbi:hypothetical protein BJ138DRAFT_30898 [Hygrophoropsis aurantiaca]|uniref:Uncharacterized protein n=1 Tax=Hygrophoropsis aurantiaca TaxID=72124 RepID=A0ACB7ZSJ0_9AGAM|nr:hypothetical protein BJ138DRAFT_30898 [Hygrophoropsis aurantiaca]